MLRNPVSRALSQYVMTHGFSKIPEFKLSSESFHAFCEDVIKCITNVQLRSRSCRHRWILRVGLYAQYVRRWLSVFPVKNLLFVQFEDYVKNPLETINRQVLPFLELPPFVHHSLAAQVSQLEVRNKAKTKLKMAPKTHAMLTSFYAPHNDELRTIFAQYNINMSLW